MCVFLVIYSLVKWDNVINLNLWITHIQFQDINMDMRTEADTVVMPTFNYDIKNPFSTLQSTGFMSLLYSLQSILYSQISVSGEILRYTI